MKNKNNPIDKLNPLGRPMSAAKQVVEVYNDNGLQTDPLGMYTGRPAEAAPDYNAVAIPRYDTEAVRYCNGKRYLRPELKGEKNTESGVKNAGVENAGVKNAGIENAGVENAKGKADRESEEISDGRAYPYTYSGTTYLMEHKIPTQDADDL